MRTFVEKSPVPAVAGAARIDIRYGGEVRDVERESIDLAEAYITTLESNRSVLYLNTLSPDLEILFKFSAARKRLRSDIRGERLKYMTMECDEIHAKRDFLVELVEGHAIRVLILNSFDFASMTPRGRRRIFEFLKFLKDHYRVHIIIYTRHEPRREQLGVFSDLAWLSESTSEIGKPILTAVKRKKAIPGRQAIATETGITTVDVVQEIDYMTFDIADASALEERTREAFDEEAEIASRTEFIPRLVPKEASAPDPEPGIKPEQVRTIVELKPDIDTNSSAHQPYPQDTIRLSYTEDAPHEDPNNVPGTLLPPDPELPELTGLRYKRASIRKENTASTTKNNDASTPKNNDASTAKDNNVLLGNKDLQGRSGEGEAPAQPAVPADVPHEKVAQYLEDPAYWEEQRLKNYEMRDDYDWLDNGDNGEPVPA